MGFRIQHQCPKYFVSSKWKEWDFFFQARGKEGNSNYNSTYQPPVSLYGGRLGGTLSGSSSSNLDLWPLTRSVFVEVWALLVLWGFRTGSTIVDLNKEHNSSKFLNALINKKKPKIFKIKIASTFNWNWVKR